MQFILFTTGLFYVQDKMTEWFNCIDEFDQKHKMFGIRMEMLMNWAKKWKDKSAVVTQLERKYSTPSVGQRKGLK